MAKEPERTCLVTREAKPKEELIRFVVSPDGVLVADLGHKLPGRGLYVSYSKLAVTDAIARKAFERAAKQPVQVPADFLAMLEKQLRARVLDALSFARKAGQALSGFEKIDDALQSGKIIGLVHASDASDDGIKKLKKEGIESFHYFTRSELSTIMGRDNAVHVGLLEGSAGAFFVGAARRFTLFLQ